VLPKENCRLAGAKKKKAEAIPRAKVGGMGGADTTPRVFIHLGVALRLGWALPGNVATGGHNAWADHTPHLPGTGPSRKRTKDSGSIKYFAFA
jgi:hypothetical protein